MKIWPKPKVPSLIDKKAALISTIETLPRINRHTLRYLMEFLSELSQYSEINKMNQNNIAIVFGPCIFKCPSEVEDSVPSASIVEESKNVSDWTVILFDYYEQIKSSVNSQNDRPGMIKQSSKESLLSKLSGSSGSLNQQRESGYVSKITNGFGKDASRKPETRKSKLSSSASIGDEMQQNAELPTAISKMSLDNMRTEPTIMRDDSFFMNYNTPMTSSPQREDSDSILNSHSGNLISSSSAGHFISASTSNNSDLGSMDDDAPNRAQPLTPLQKITETQDDSIGPAHKSRRVSIANDVDLGLQNQAKLPSRQQTIIPQKNQVKLLVKEEILAKRSSTGTGHQMNLKSANQSKELVNMFKSKRYSVEVGNLKQLQKNEEWKNPLTSILGNEDREQALSRSQTLNKKPAKNQPVLKPGEFTPQQQKLLENLHTINLDEITPENLEDVKYMFKTLYNKLYINIDNVVTENSKDDMEIYNKLKFIIKSTIILIRLEKGTYRISEI